MRVALARPLWKVPLLKKFVAASLLQSNISFRLILDRYRVLSLVSETPVKVLDQTYLVCALYWLAVLID